MFIGYKVINLYSIIQVFNFVYLNVNNKIEPLFFL